LKILIELEELDWKSVEKIARQWNRLIMKIFWASDTIEKENSMKN
jgi:hypothetical protein